MKLLRYALTGLTLAAIAGIAVFFLLGPMLIERASNRIVGDPGPEPTPATLAFHRTLTIADLHADSLLWDRDLSERSDYGQVDIPRMLEGNLALQMFTTVTKSPRGQNYQSNAADAADNITLLALAQRWPGETRDSLFARARHQGNRLMLTAAEDPRLMLVRSVAELNTLMALRADGQAVVGGLLGTEGSHALDGDLDNIDRLFANGFRMMSLQHFFDNRLGGSLHGESNAGLSSFGAAAVDRMLALGIMIDVSHSSEAVVRDVLARSDRPVLVSHTGFKGHCDRKRNLSDATLRAIAAEGGLIGVGFWDEAVCGESIDAIVGALRYGIDLVGVDHVALGSDWDGSVATPIDAAGLPRLTQALREAAFSDAEIRAVMGGNLLRYLREHLPPI